MVAHGQTFVPEEWVLTLHVRDFVNRRRIFLVVCESHQLNDRQYSSRGRDAETRKNLPYKIPSLFLNNFFFIINQIRIVFVLVVFFNHFTKIEMTAGRILWYSLRADKGKHILCLYVYNENSLNRKLTKTVSSSRNFINILPLQ